MTDDLLHRAFSRGSTDQERAAAQAELARSTPTAPRVGIAVPVLRRPAVPRLLLVALLGAVAGLGLVATVNATFVPPAAALQVFDRAAIDADADAPTWVAADATEVRWLADEASWRLFAYRTGSGEVCIAAARGSAGGGSSCTLEERFARTGLDLTVYARESGRVDRIAVTWGADGSLDVQVASLE